MKSRINLTRREKRPDRPLFSRNRRELIVATTARLVLRQAVLDDAAFMRRLLNEPSWKAFITRHSIVTISQAADYIARKMISAYDRLGFGLWIVEPRATRAPAGICGLVERDSLEYADLGFAFLEEFWGRGYAFEASRWVLSYAARTLRAPKVLAITFPENRRSIRVLVRLGFEYESTFSHPGSTEILALYAVRPVNRNSGCR